MKTFVFSNFSPLALAILKGLTIELLLQSKAVSTSRSTGY